MKTNTCRIAANPALALGEEARGRMHTQCPKAYINESTGGVEACGCDCHVGEAIPTPTDAEALPVLAVPVSAPEPEPPNVDRPAPARAVPGGSSCECGCGRPTGGKFAPGHDAKLKSSLLKEAKLMRPNAWAELILRGWDHLVAEDKRPHRSVVAQGELIVLEKGHALVVARTEARRNGTLALY